MTQLEDKLQEAENNIVKERARLANWRTILKVGWMTLAYNAALVVACLVGMVAAQYGYIKFEYPIAFAFGSWAFGSVFAWYEVTRLRYLHLFEFETGNLVRKLLSDTLRLDEENNRQLGAILDRTHATVDMPKLQIDELSAPSLTLERAIEIARHSQEQVDQLSKKLEWSMEAFEGYKILSEQLRETLVEAARTETATQRPPKGRPGRPKEVIPQAARDYGIATTEQFQALLAEARAAKESGRGELGRWCKEKRL